ncbi:MAG: TlpA disulfide reductase family protein [Gemmatimonadales bacterium]
MFARLALAAVFFIAAIAKLLDRPGSRAALAGFGIPASLTAPLAIVLPTVELLVALALLPGQSARVAAFAAASLLLLFVAGIGRIMIRGQVADCHCFGQLHSSRVGWGTLFRNVVLGAIALFVVVGDSSNPSPSYVDWVRQLAPAEVWLLIVGAVLVAAIAGGAWFMMHLLRQHGRLLLRLDALEEKLASASFGIGSADGLAIGIRAPAFSLSNLDGSTVSLSDLLAQRLPVLLVFGHPDCGPCVSMFPEIGGWQRKYRDIVDITVIAEGTAEDNRVLAATHRMERVLLQRGRDVAEEYEAYGTPSALLISPEGLIASAVAQGIPAVRALVESFVSKASQAAHVESTNGSNGNGVNHRNGEAAFTLSPSNVDAG